MAWVRRDLKDYSQPSCHGQGHFTLHQVAQGPIQPGLEHSLGQGMSQQHHSEEFLISNLSIPCQFKAITSYPTLHALLRSSYAT